MSENKGVNVLKVWEVNNKIHIPNKKVQLEVIELIASLFSVGSLFYYIFNFETQEIEHVSDGVNEILGVDADELNIQTIFDKMHPEDLAKMPIKEETTLDFLFNKIPLEDILFYKVVYLIRLKHSDGTYKKILDQSRTINISKDGKVQQVIVILSDVSNLNVPHTDNISFIGSNRPAYYAIWSNGKYHLNKNGFKEKFSEREIEIAAKISKGNTSKDIAKLLAISIHTVNTHKKNILRKSECKNTSELVVKCITEGVI